MLSYLFQEFGVKNLVYSSTCATYGNPSVLPITEMTPTEPINPYGKVGGDFLIIFSRRLCQIVSFLPLMFMS